MTILRPLERPAVRRASAIALAILVIVFAVQTWRKAHRPDGNDLTGYLTAARALASGSSPYDAATPFPYIYPLFLAFALIPFAALPYDVAVLSWFVVSIGALGWLFAWIARREDSGGRPDAIPVAAIVLILLTAVVQSNLLNGQVNFVVLACCIAAVGAGSRRLEGALGGSNGFGAAAWWGAAIATKILPLALAPWWLLRRRPLVVVGAIAAAVALALAPALAAGAAAFDWTALYARGFLSASLESGAPADALRFSLYGVVEPLAPWVPWLPLACGLAVIAAVAAADARGGVRDDDHVAYSLYLAAIPLASPKSETHHLAFALPAAYVCALRMLRYQIHPGDWRRRTVLLSAASFLAGNFLEPARNWLWCVALVMLCAATAGLMTAPKGVIVDQSARHDDVGRRARSADEGGGT